MSETDMADERKRRRWLWLVAACPSLLLVPYCGCYHYGCVNPSGLHGSERWRVYESGTLSKAFIPAAWVEAQLTRTRVHIQHIRFPDRSSVELDGIFNAEPMSG